MFAQHGQAVTRCVTHEARDHAHPFTMYAFIRVRSSAQDWQDCRAK